MNHRLAFLVREQYGWACAWCGRQSETQVHHVEPKGMGGRHGAARKVSEDVANLVPLCRVCHGAAHGERVVDGWSCRECDRECGHRVG